MPSFYTYLIANLPSLSFGAKPPISLVDFFDACSRSIEPSKLEELKRAVENPGWQLKGPHAGVLKKWHEFDISLRNELARVRSARLKQDPLKYSRGEVCPLAEETHIAMTAYRNKNIIEAERYLDLQRWRFLDWAACLHYFDIDALAAYALKLKILTRWDRINSADKKEVLERSLKKEEDNA